VEGDCPEAVPVRAGERPPSALLDDDGRWTCSAVLVPVGDVLHREELIAHGEAWEAYGLGVAARWRADTQVQALQLEAAYREIDRLAAPPPLLDRPSTIRALSDVKVAAVIGLAVYVATQGGQ